MATALKNAQQKAFMAAKEERARDAALAMQEYEAEKLAIRVKTARLRALRLAKEAESSATNEEEERSRRGTFRKNAAIRNAIDRANNHKDDAQVLVQTPAGQWRTEWTYGHDPYPPPA